MPQLPTSIHSAAQVRALDRYAIEVSGIAGFTLMTRAAQAALELLRATWPDARSVVVVCGSGNNGGDGYCLAKLAHAAGLRVRALAAGPPSQLKGDALRARHECQETGVVLRPYSPAELASADVIVDAIFGTGLDRPVDAPAAAVIGDINASGRPVFALDIPSGLHADTGAVMGAAVGAVHTITFVALKSGLFLGRGIALRGQLHFDDLGIGPMPDELREPVLCRLEPGLLATLPRRPRDAHKGHFGSVLVIGGGRGMPGAARLCGEAALRSGAGRATAATHSENVAAIVSGRPELMCHGVKAAAALAKLLAKTDVAVVGPGLGTDEWSRAMLDAALDSILPLVVDADGLNLLAAKPQRRANWILTPHPGEAARLLDWDPVRVQRDRLAALRELLARYGGVVVLKGSGTLVGAENRLPSVCDLGNPGMATAGTGDVLAGMVAGLLAQLGDPLRAAQLAVLAHALAGDSAAAGGERGMIASDLLSHIRPWLNLSPN